MKTKITLLFCMFVLLFLSCKKEEPTPTACITGPESIDRGQNVSYVWCGSDVEEVQWSTSYGETSFGNSFSPAFPSIGKHTITVTGKRKGKTASETKEVSYGVSNKITCRILHNCYTGNNGIGDATGYKAYLYGSITDWNTDLKNRSYSLALDSGFCTYSASYATIYAEFTTTHTKGQNLYFYIVKGSGDSNAGNLTLNARNPNTDSYNGQVVLSESGGETTYTFMDYASKQLLSGTWKLKQHQLNGNPITIAPCNQDDYISFSPTGTWKYEVGTDNCSGASQTSSGTFVYSPLCTFGSYIQMNTVTGPFSGITNGEFNYSEIKVHYQSGTNQGVFVFGDY